MRGAKVGAVAGEREGPLLSGFVEILGDEVAVPKRCMVPSSRTRVTV